MRKQIHTSFKKCSLMLLALILMSITASASHYRFGLVTATRLSETSTTVTYRINVSEAWRLTQAPTSASYTISGGNTGSLTVSLTNVTDPSGNWTNSTGSATVTLNKSTTPTKLEYSNCCKISTTVNNHDANWDEFVILNTNGPGSSPVSTLPAIVNLPIGATSASFTIPATDPDAGATLTFGTPSFTGNLAGETEPNSSFAVNSSTGVVTMNTTSCTVGQLYNAMATVTDNDGNKIELDFIIQMVGASNPPVFDYTVTPTNNTVYNVIAGQNLSFNIKAADSDPGATVGFSVSGLNSYITTSNFSPSLPNTTSGASTVGFSYTPAAAQIGSSFVLNFIASDNNGVQATSSVTIKVVAEPAPVFISPTPGQGTITQIQTGATYTEDIKAESSLGSNVSIAFATGIPSGASFSPTIPTTGANPGLTTMTWTPTPADFGVKNLSFQATIASTPTIFSTRSFQLIVNTPPAFGSTPSLIAFPGVPYSYTITITDPDMSYGDLVNVIAASPLPSWLTLTKTGNGTATLSGTPAASDAGINSVDLEAEDTYHHGNPSEVSQSFDIVVGCPTITQTSTVVSPLCNGNSNGTITIAASGSNGYTYSIDNGSTYQSSNSFTGLSAGSKTILVKDAYNCYSTPQTVTLTNPTALTASYTIGTAYPLAGQELQTIYLDYKAPTFSPASAQTELLTASGSGGTGSYTYQWMRSACNGVSTAMNNIANADQSTYTWSPTSTSSDVCNGNGDNLYYFTVSVKDANNCIATATPKRLNVVNPFITGGNGNLQICHKVAVRGGSTTQLLSVTPSQVATHLAHGDYLANCAVFNGVRTVEPEAMGQEVVVYPNPSTGVFVLELSYITEEANIFITDVQGKLVAQKTLSNQAAPTATFDLTGLAKGMYLVQVRDGELNYRTKIIVQ